MPRDGDGITIEPHPSGRGFRGRVELGRDDDGRRLRKRIPGPFDRKKDVVIAGREMRRNWERNRGIAAPTTVADYLDEWLPRRAEARGLRPATVADYRWKADQIVACIGAVHLSELKPRHIVEAHQEIASRPSRRRPQQKVSNATVRGIMKVLKMAIADACELGYLSNNPVDAARPYLPRVGATHRNRVFSTWTSVELQRFLEEMRSDRWEALWVVLARTGMRRAEVVGLHLEDLDLDTATLHIRRTRVVAAGKVIDQDVTKTDAGHRFVSLDEATVSALRAWVSRRREMQLAASPQLWQQHPHVFIEDDGRPLDPDAVTRSFQRRVRNVSGLPTIRLHDLRHTVATIAANAPGVSLQDVAARLGHSSITITEQYVHRDSAGDERAARAVADSLTPLANIPQEGSHQ